MAKPSSRTKNVTRHEMRHCERRDKPWPKGDWSLWDAWCSCGWESSEQTEKVARHAMLDHRIDVLAKALGIEFEVLELEAFIEES